VNYKTAAKINETFSLDGDYNIQLNGQIITDPMCKGYIYANMFFYDEVQKEIAKLRDMVKTLHDEVIMELGLDPTQPEKLLLEISTRARRAIGDDGMDCLIKEFLAERGRHIALLVDQKERDRFNQICEAIFIELTKAFFVATLQDATDLENDVKTFKFTHEYIEAMTERQKPLLTPAIRMIGFENQLKLNNLEVTKDYTVKYRPEPMPVTFTKQENTIKDQIKTFAQNALS
jgi:hypothetical protein